MKLQHTTRCGKASSVGLDGRRETGIATGIKIFGQKKAPPKRGLELSYCMKVT